MILDEIHLLGADRGPILEVLFVTFSNKVDACKFIDLFMLIVLPHW